MFVCSLLIHTHTSHTFNLFYLPTGTPLWQPKLPRTCFSLLHCAQPPTHAQHDGMCACVLVASALAELPSLSLSCSSLFYISVTQMMIKSFPVRVCCAGAIDEQISVDHSLCAFAVQVRSMSIGHRDGPLPSASNDGMGSGFGAAGAATPPGHSRAGSVQVCRFDVVCMCVCAHMCRSVCA